MSPHCLLYEIQTPLLNKLSAFTACMQRALHLYCPLLLYVQTKLSPHMTPLSSLCQRTYLKLGNKAKYVGTEFFQNHGGKSHPKVFQSSVV